MPSQLDPARSPFRSSRIGNATFAIGAETANVITVAVQLQDARRRNLATRTQVRWAIFADANGDAFIATAPDGGVAAGTNGAILQTVTGKYGVATVEANGRLDVAITHAAGAKTVYLGIELPDGSYVVSSAITFV
jgi:hypothetical protein